MGERSAAGFEQRAAGIRFFNQIPKLMRTIPKTIIAMVNGAAVGAGLSMALACDLRIAGRPARFGTGLLKISLSGDWGGSWTLTRLVGTAKARELYLLGDMIDAQQAHAYGMENQVADDAAP
jgi:2-(1,2-epoxy-1,2-dihydrophenyl)acetyl-CoA isomerase